MVEERNAFITTMKSEIYRKEYLNDTEKMDLHQQLLQKDTIMKKLEVRRGRGGRWRRQRGEALCVDNTSPPPPPPPV